MSFPNIFMHPCVLCKGKGIYLGEVCPMCIGTGRTQDHARRCNICNGEGSWDGRPCASCNGTGKIAHGVAVPSSSPFTDKIAELKEPVSELMLVADVHVNFHCLISTTILNALGERMSLEEARDIVHSAFTMLFRARAGALGRKDNPS